MIRILHRDGQGNLSESHTIEALPQLLAERTGMVWVETFELDEASGGDRSQMDYLLREVFNVHHLAIEDALVDSQSPKVDDWGEYLYIALHAVRFDVDLEDVDTSEVDIFLGKNFLFTHHTEPVPAIDRHWKNVLCEGRHTKRGADFCLYELCDAIAADYLPCMDAIEDSIDRIEDHIFDGANPRVVNQIFKLKSAVLNLRRVLSPQREVFNKLARDDYRVIDPADRVYFRDVYDHFVRLTDLNESLRDLVSGTMDTYLSVAANRTNDVMKVLTIVNVLFMPLAFLSSFFGMNFFGGHMEVLFPNPPLAPWLVFALCLVLMVSVPTMMYTYIRRRGWW